MQWWFYFKQCWEIVKQNRYSFKQWW